MRAVRLRWLIFHATMRAATPKGPSTLFATVDGYPIPNPASYRAHSPNFFVNLPPDNLLGTPAGVYGPAASDGYWLMLVPCGPGRTPCTSAVSSRTARRPT